MPFVRIVVTDEGISRSEKAEIAQRTTATLVDVLGKDPATTAVVIEEVPTDHWAIGGELVDARRARGVGGAETTSPLGAPLGDSFGRSARDRRAEALSPDAAGARAALEAFYFAFNQRSLEALEDVWAPDASIMLANPLGGVLTGIADIKALYRRLFEGPARIWVEYHDITEYIAGGHAMFVGRERGELEVNGARIALAIRTSRYFRQLPKLGWRQVHHHGSIDDPELLRAYQHTVRSAAPPSRG